MPAAPSRTEFWTMVGGAAGVLGVLATIIFGVTQCSTASSTSTVGSDSGHTSSQSGPNPATSTPSSPVQPSPSPSPWPGLPAGISYKTGGTTLTGWLHTPYSTFDLEENKKTENGLGDERDDLSAQMEAGVSVGNGAKIALWSGPQPPTLQDCLQLPITEWDRTEVIAPDHFLTPATYCVKSNDGRVGRIKTISANIGQNVRSDFNFSYLLWKKAGDK